MDGTATSKSARKGERAAPPPDDGRQRLQKAVGWVWVLLVVSLAFRLCYIALRQLVADEAVYWSWSRHLATGYLDHPPMIVYLIHLGTAVFGTNEFGVRFFCPLLAAGMLALMLLLAKRVLREPRAVLWVGIIWLTSPLLAGLGTIATPDTPAVFFSLCALICVVVLFTGDTEGRPYSASAGAGLWLAFGAFCGLAFTSKYTTVLLPASVGLALLTSPEGRRQLARPWPWLSAAPALLVFSPVILWNRAHRWASFKFQFNHGLSHAKAAAAAAGPEGGLAHLGHGLLAALLGLARYVGNELLVGTPVFFVLGIVLLVVFWRRYRRLDAADRVLLWSATVPLAFFAYASLRAQSEANWPNFAYFPLSLLIVRWAAQTWDAGRVGLLRTGCIVAAVGLVVLHVPEAIGAVLPGKLHAKVMAKLDEMAGGWRLLAREVDALDPGRAIVTEKFQDAANIGFYAKGHPEAWPVGDSDPVDDTSKADDGKKHRRPFAFDYFDDEPGFGAVDHVLFVGYHYQHFAERYGLKMPKDGAVISTVTLPTGGTFKLSFILLDRPPAGTQHESPPE